MTSVIPIIAVLLASMTFSASVTLPQRRSFLPLRGTLDLTPDSLTLRVQQFNVLADGLSGARKDLGGFVRATPEILAWENRKEPLLHEITQYGADVVTMQECDHFNDFFQPRMRELGYVGYFAAKPTSGCLDVSDNADGCALFVKESKFRVISCESKSLALSIAKLKEGELEEDETSISQQNQIAIIAVIEFINYKGKKEQQQPRVYNSDADYERMFEEKPEDDVLPGSNDKDVPPPIIVSTAHLKSSKTATGERFRQKAMLKILTEVERVAMDFGRKGRPPAVLIAADLNADAKPAPDQSKVFGSLRGTYAPLTWNAARMHRLAMKSVYHDDISSIIRITNNSNNNNKDKGGEGSSIEIPAMQAYLPSVSPEEVYTTWKYRGSKQQRERGGRDGEGAREVRRHIDYILYTPFRRGPPNPALGRGSRRILGGGIRYNKVSGGGGSSINITPASTTSTSTSRSSSSSSRSRSSSNTKKKSSSVVATKSDQLVISVLLRIAVYTFGSVIPLAAVIDSNLSTMEKVVVGLLGLIGLLVFETSSRGTIFKPEIEEEVVIESIYNEVRPDAYRVDGQSTAGIAISESKRQGRQLLNGIRRVSKIIQTEAYGRPGLQPLAVLDLYGPETVGVEAGLLPSAHYPSDHLSIAADFQLRWEK